MGTGTADLACVLNKVDFWVETKIDRGRGPELVKEQVAWHLRRWTVGSKTFVMSRRATSLDMDGFVLYRPRLQLNEFHLEKLYEGRFPRVDWDEVFKICCMNYVVWAT